MSHWHRNYWPANYWPKNYWYTIPLEFPNGKPDLTIGLRLFLKRKELTTPMQQAKIDEQLQPPYIAYSRIGHRKVLGSSGMTLSETTEFALDIFSNDLDDCQSIAKKIKTILHGYKGMIGRTRTLQCECLDHSDDYYSQNSKDDGLFSASLYIKIDH